jgi:hypothetical protein
VPPSFDNILQCIARLPSFIAAKLYISQTKLAMKDEELESKSSSEADTLWIQKVTGFDMEYREWTNYVIDETIHPGPNLTQSLRTSVKLCISYARIYLNPILSDFILCPEFEGALQVLLDLEVTKGQTSDTKKLNCIFHEILILILILLKCPVRLNILFAYTNLSSKTRNFFSSRE